MVFEEAVTGARAGAEPSILLLANVAGHETSRKETEPLYLM